MDIGNAQPDALAETIAGQIGRTAGPVTPFGLEQGLPLEWLIWAPYMTLAPDGPRTPIRRYTGDRRSLNPSGRITLHTRVIIASFFGLICGDDHPCINRSEQIHDKTTSEPDRPL
jgi:hypothetical protein